MVTISSALNVDIFGWKMETSIIDAPDRMIRRMMGFEFFPGSAVATPEPTESPTAKPTDQTQDPTTAPSTAPTIAPSTSPTGSPITLAVPVIIACNGNCGCGDTELCTLKLDVLCLIFLFFPAHNTTYICKYNDYLQLCQ